MQNIIKWPVIVAINLFVLFVVLMPWGGLVYAVLLSASALMLVLNMYAEVPSIEVMYIFFYIGWKIYLAVAVMVFFIITAWQFQNCCVGLQRFRDHLAHRGIRGYVSDILFSLSWGYAVFIFDRSLRGWYSSWTTVSLNALEFWFPLNWLSGEPKGTRIETFDSKTGESTVVYVKSSEEAEDALRSFVNGTTHKDITPK